MAMRKSTRSELNKLRELVHYLLAERKCCFCKQPLIEVPDGWVPGTGSGPPLKAKVAVHHKDGWEDPVKDTQLCHRKCHLRHHAKQRIAAGTF